MKYIFIALLFIFTSCKAQVQPLRIADDSIYTYHTAPVDRESGTLGDMHNETVKFYFYNGSKASEMLCHIVGTSSVFDFVVDSIVLKQRDDTAAYFGVVGKYHIDGSIIPGSLLIVSSIHDAARHVYLFIGPKNVFAFYN